MFCFPVQCQIFDRKKFCTTQSTIVLIYVALIVTFWYFRSTAFYFNLVLPIISEKQRKINKLDQTFLSKSYVFKYTNTICIDLQLTSLYT